MKLLTDARKAATCLLLATGLIASLTASVSFAAERDQAFTMTVIHDAYFGRKVIAGDYETAIDRIHPRGDGSAASFEAHTNLCVAYVKAGEIDRAEAACDAAVEAAWKQTSRVARFGASYDEKIWREYAAVALSNRGVLHAVAGRPELAQADFSKALELQTRSDTPGSNLARLRTDVSM